jgi:hypothetical protein
MHRYNCMQIQAWADFIVVSVGTSAFLSGTEICWRSLYLKQAWTSVNLNNRCGSPIA